MFDRSHDILAMSFLGAMTALSCTPAPLRSPGNRTRVRLANDGSVLEREESPALTFLWRPGPRKQGMFLGNYHSLLVVGPTLCPLFARSFGPSSQIALACVSGAAHLRQ